MRIEFVMFLPLWKLSSMGGIILCTFPRISFLVALAIVKKPAKIGLMGSFSPGLCA